MLCWSIATGEKKISSLILGQLLKKEKKKKDSFLVKAQETMKRNEREKKTQTDYAVNFSCHNVLQR